MRLYNEKCYDIVELYKRLGGDVVTFTLTVGKNTPVLSDIRLTLFWISNDSELLSDVTEVQLLPIRTAPQLTYQVSVKLPECIETPPEKEFLYVQLDPDCELVVYRLAMELGKPAVPFQREG